MHPGLSEGSGPQPRRRTDDGIGAFLIVSFSFMNFAVLVPVFFSQTLLSSLPSPVGLDNYRGKSNSTECLFDSSFVKPALSFIMLHWGAWGLWQPHGAVWAGGSEMHIEVHEVLCSSCPLSPVLGDCTLQLCPAAVAGSHGLGCSSPRALHALLDQGLRSQTKKEP